MDTIGFCIVCIGVMWRSDSSLMSSERILDDLGFQIVFQRHHRVLLDTKEGNNSQFLTYS